MREDSLASSSSILNARFLKMGILSHVDMKSKNVHWEGVSDVSKSHQKWGQFQLASMASAAKERTVHCLHGAQEPQDSAAVF